MTVRALNGAFVAVCVVWSNYGLAELASHSQSAHVDLTFDWYEEPYRLYAAGHPIDVAENVPSRNGLWFSSEGSGHAAPVLADVNADGIRDLVVGGFSGHFRWYENLGTEKSPKFDEYLWLIADDTPLVVRNYCCIAAGIRVSDIDGDGLSDLVVTSYEPGAVYWSKGRIGGLYGPRRALIDASGVPVLTNFDQLDEDFTASFGASVEVADWDSDGKNDLVLGNARGDLVVRLNKGPAIDVGITDNPTQPVFARFFNRYQSMDSEKSVLLGQEPAFPEDRYTSPSLADWDSDGLLDLIVGVESGAIYWLRNIGEEGRPQFATKEMILGPTRGWLWLESHSTPSRGGRARVQSTDVNGDGLQDLLVGDWSASVKPRSGLTAEELEQLIVLWAELESLDEDFLRSQGHSRHLKGVSIHQAEPELGERLLDLQNRISPFLESSDDSAGSSFTSKVRYHGFVWVYLRKDGSSE